jgi:Flp pilus assembly protein TadD
MRNFLAIASSLVVCGSLAAAGVQHPEAEQDDQGALQLEAEGKFEEAARAFREILKRTPDDTNALVGLGVGLARQGQYSEAVVAYQKALL